MRSLDGERIGVSLAIGLLGADVLARNTFLSTMAERRGGTMGVGLDTATINSGISYLARLEKT